MRLNMPVLGTVGVNRGEDDDDDSSVEQGKDEVSINRVLEQQLCLLAVNVCGWVGGSCCVLFGLCLTVCLCMCVCGGGWVCVRVCGTHNVAFYLACVVAFELVSVHACMCVCMRAYM